MKVILNKDVPSLGEEGDVKDVAPGYARNYLMPNGMVMPYNPQSLAQLESRRAAIEARKEQKLKDAQGTRERLENEEIEIKMTAGERGRLFGSVTSANIVEHLEKLGVSVDRKRVDVPGGTIKELGTFPIRVRLYGDEEATVKVRVEPDEKSAPQMTAEERAAEKAAEAASEQEADAEAAVSEEPPSEGETVTATAEEDETSTEED
jgi:large subunit ribosomal protein L9